jgi:transcriptional regulator with XRE-family HTH domain
MSQTNLKLKSRIVALHGSQADFADELGVDESIVSRVVRGRRELSAETKKAWASLLNAKVKEIFPEG